MNKESFNTAREAGSSTFYAAVGSDGTRAVVWGLGETAGAAITESTSEEGAPGRIVLVAIDCAIAERILEGTIDCATLGIAITVDRDGAIKFAEFTPTTAADRDSQCAEHDCARWRCADDHTEGA